MPSILVLIADGFEEFEAVSIIDICRRAEISVSVCSLNLLDVKGANNIILKSDLLIKDINDTDSYDAVVLPGGDKNARSLKKSQSVNKILKDFNTKNKLIASICASSIVLDSAGVISGDYTCYPGYNNEITSGNFVEQNVVQSANILTSRGPATSSDFAFKLVSILCDDEKSKRIKQQMLYSN